VNWVYEFDLSTFRAINIGLHSSWLDPVFWFFSFIGLGGMQAAISLLFLFQKSTRHYVIPLLLADAVSGIVVADGLKSIITRDRPSKLPFAIREEDWLVSSFPSGHSTTAFAVATMLVFLTWNTKYRKFGQLSLIEAAFIGFSRIYRGVHWPTDVFAGACFGIATSCLLYLILPKFRIPIQKEESVN